MIDNRITVKDDGEVNIQGGAIGHRSTWASLTYKYTVEEGRTEEVEAIIREAISGTKGVQESEIRGRCEKPESCESFFNTMFTPALQKSFEIEAKEKNDDTLDVEFHHCPLLKAWQDLGSDDALCAGLCDMVMDGGGNITKAVGFDFHLGDTITDGCPTCRVRFSRKR